MLGTLWHLVPARIRREAVRQIAIIAASSTERLETRIRSGESALAAFHEEEDSHQADVDRRLHQLDQRVHGFDARLLSIESGLATLQEITDQLERVAMPAAMSRAEALERKVSHIEATDSKLLHAKLDALRRDLDGLKEDLRRMFDYWEVRTDHIYANLAAHQFLPEAERATLDAVSARMKGDWNRRAREDAKWSVNTYKRDQTDEEFFRQGEREVQDRVRDDLDLLCAGRDPGTLRLLEIGCGVGRMTRPLAAIFGEVVATDVAGEMVRRCRESVAGLANVTCFETSGYDFRDFPEASFDVVFSAYVYQHVPSPEVIRAGLSDAFRVLRPGGVMFFMVNGVEAGEGAAHGDTWAGAMFPESEVRALGVRLGARLRGVRGAGRQYLSVWWTKPVPLPAAVGPIDVVLVREVSATERIARLRGDDEASVWMIVRGLSPDDDCERLRCEIGGRVLAPSYAGPVRFRPNERPEAAPKPVPGTSLIEVPVPADVPAGRHAVRVRAGIDRVSAAEVELTLERGRPVIVLLANDVDGGIDVHRSGAKSAIRVFVVVPGRARSEPMEISIDGRSIATQTEYLERHGYFLLRGQLPETSPGGEIPIAVRAGRFVSPTEMLKVEDIPVS
jgi:SAM-dependent methyltransferase